MALIRMLFKLMALPLIVAVTIIQWVGIFLTGFSGIIFNLFAGLIFLITLIGFALGVTAGIEALKMLAVGFVIFMTAPPSALYAANGVAVYQGQYLVHSGLIEVKFDGVL